MASISGAGVIGGRFTGVVSAAGSVTIPTGSNTAGAAGNAAAFACSYGASVTGTPCMLGFIAGNPAGQALVKCFDAAGVPYAAGTNVDIWWIAAP